ncbi:uncharacterized protein Z519_07951 [Cladophialophora bantiana CBS 173.52]|uniref:Uncharacterized protein n=1 Tax=Cladophialophora bantiana (strain ATCC 10958 / CBS 173.52 / CDC B-1940 / NIH 8579) TaxID=1442370 RepID=A0A0D2FX44_CLAB1|nr:uncharacterized protein Z519_07951 [Cladophialophora bantiana CBS 173.52]KIW91057.1 hypothetical protein Z519_07951 [Cladophialophora bantiana CBS 173.52]
MDQRPRKAMRYLTSGRRDRNALILAEQHKLRAVRKLRHLLEAYRQFGGFDLLKKIRGASSQLAACGVISGDTWSAQIYFAGVKMAVGLMGGLENTGPMQSECLVFSQVAGAWFDRSRPVFHPDEWDPGAVVSTETGLLRAALFDVRKQFCFWCDIEEATKLTGAGTDPRSRFQR